MADAGDGKTIRVPTRRPPWIVVNHNISKVIISKWPGRLWRAKVIEAATPEDQASRGGPPRASAEYTRAISVFVEAEIPVEVLFGGAGDRILPIIDAATNLTRKQAETFAAGRSPEAAEAASRVWKRWLEHVGAPELYEHGDFDRTLAVPAVSDRSPVRSALTVVHNEVFQRAKALEGSAATVDDGEDVWLIEPWSTAASVVTDAALAQAPSDFVSEADFAVLTRGWKSLEPALASFVLTIYWWESGTRSAGGEYPFSAADDAAAISYVRANLEEQVSLADQSILRSGGGRLVWENEWPIEQGADRLPPR